MNAFLIGGRPWGTAFSLGQVVGIMAGLVALPLLDAPVLAGGTKHVQEAVEHANEAVGHGSQGQAGVATKHAKSAVMHLSEVK